MHVDVWKWFMEEFYRFNHFHRISLHNLISRDKSKTENHTIFSSQLVISSVIEWKQFKFLSELFKSRKSDNKKSCSEIILPLPSFPENKLHLENTSPNNLQIPYASRAFIDMIISRKINGIEREILSTYTFLKNKK